MGQDNPRESLGLHSPAVDDADMADDVLDGLGGSALAPDVWGMHL